MQRLCLLPILLSLGQTSTFSASVSPPDYRYISRIGCDSLFGIGAQYGDRLNTCLRSANATKVYIYNPSRPVIGSISLVAVDLLEYASPDCSGAPYSSILTSNGASNCDDARTLGLQSYLSYLEDLPSDGGTEAATLTKLYYSASCDTIIGFTLAPTNTCMQGNYRYSCSSSSPPAKTLNCSGPESTPSPAPPLSCSPSSSSSSPYPYRLYESSQCLFLSPLSVGTTDANDLQCFAGHERVLREDGTLVPIADIRVGETILSATRLGATLWSRVVAVPHVANSRAAVLVKISTRSASLSLTADHLIMAGQCANKKRRTDGHEGPGFSLTRAYLVRTGDCVLTAEGAAEVTKVEKERVSGLYSVVTQEELVVVNGFVASPFARNHAVPYYFYAAYTFIQSWMMIPSLKNNAGAFDVILNFLIILISG